MLSEHFKLIQTVNHLILRHNTHLGYYEIMREVMM